VTAATAAATSTQAARPGQRRLPVLFVNLR
jgi:hypothetical protein